MRNILITGGAGFIGSHVVKRWVKKYPNVTVTNLDKLTYAGNLATLEEIQNSPNYRFIKGDICDTVFINALFEKEKFDGVIHLAAESHVDRSISDPMAFVNTNVIGTVNLLNAAKSFWKENTDKLFYHISTDEVFGSLSDTGFFTEKTAYDPKSPYSASKASSDHFVRAYQNTYNLPIVISNCSNNYGPFQFPEKLIPVVIRNIKQSKKIPVYGNGQNIRDWLYVEDHAEAIDVVFHSGRVGATYTIGGHNEWKNIDIVKEIIVVTDEILGNPKGHSMKLISYVTDRPGHDHRYAIDATKIKMDLGWTPAHTFEMGIRKTVKWYIENEKWLNEVSSGAYQKYYEEHYGAKSILR